jgi:uncharacterized protein DUF4252
MNTNFKTKSWLPLLLALLALTPRDLAAQGPKLQLDHLNRLADAASETVDVTVDPATLQTAGFLSGHDVNDAKIKALIEGIKGIYIKSFEFTAAGAYSEQDIETVRKQLAAPGWSRMVSVREKDELTEIYFWREGGQNGGLAVLSAESKELTIVNIVGRVDLAALTAMGKLMPKLPRVPNILK